MGPWFRLLEESSLSIWLRESPSLLAFPGVLTAHTMAMGFLAGTSVLVALRLLGFPCEVPIPAMEPLFQDFSAGYLAHRALHLFPILWRFHRVHHSDEFVDATTTYRTHPVETVWRFLFVIVPVWTLGIPAQAVVIQRLVSAANGIVEHANIRLWGRFDRVASLVWVTPNVHTIHHSRQREETNSNYGNVLTIYDRMLGTFTSSDRAVSVVYGLDDADPTRMGSLGALLSMPFAQEVQHSLTQKSGSDRAYIDTIPIWCGFWSSKTSANWRRFSGRRCRRSTTTSSWPRPAKTGSSAQMPRYSTWSCSI
jgi:sterol desaturase/sphingolipid hydroxylase (fatty acid hydroxylase superfamily)